MRVLAFATVVLASALLGTPSSADPPPTFLGSWGTPGTGDGQFNAPAGIAVSSGTPALVYVTDVQNNCVQEFDAQGTFIRRWGSFGTASGQFDNPGGIAVDTHGDVFVADQGNNRVQQFSAQGVYLAQWITYQPRFVGVTPWVGWVFDTEDDYLGSHVNVFDSRSGNFVATWPLFGNGGTAWYGVVWDRYNGVFVASGVGNIVHIVNGYVSTTIGSNGSGDGQFNGPRGIAINQSGTRLFVADWWECRIQVITASGAFVTKWGIRGIRPGQFLHPYGIALDRDENIYVTDMGNRNVQKFGSGATPTFRSSWGRVKTLYR